MNAEQIYTCFAKMEQWAKGTVTPLASAFPVAEANKAVKKIEETLDTSRKELQKLDGFLQDNRNLMKLVQKLPDEISHNIMVPFGKAAFFPGRMIHTNEFLVLLGEGYHVERTAKQTLEVLRRCAKVLESNIEGVNAVMEDLHAEASFFTNAAAEAAAGVMEIREEYVEKPAVKENMDIGHDSSSVIYQPNTEDKEFDQIMSRLSELEKEEAEDSFSGSEESDGALSEFNRMKDNENEESEDEKVEPQTQFAMGSSMDKRVTSSCIESLMSKGSFEVPRNQHMIRSPADILKFEEWKGKSNEKDWLPKKKVSFQMDPVETTSIEVSKGGKDIAKPFSLENHERSFPLKTQAWNDEHENKRNIDSRKAFTGLIVEHSASDVSNTVKEETSQTPESKPSRPVSRFKMQKANR